MARCQLEDHGFELIFEAFESLRRSKSIDLSHNSITDKGLIEVAGFIGSNKKTELKVIKLNYNHITDVSVVKLLKAMEKYENKIEELHFYENDLTDESAYFIANWIKNMRMKDVPHSMNLVQCDMTMNKCMPKSLKEVENQIQVN